MNWTDFWVITIVIIGLGLIVFFSFFFKRKEKDGCSSCQNGSKGKRLIKNFNKKYHNKKANNDKD